MKILNTEVVRLARCEVTQEDFLKLVPYAYYGRTQVVPHTSFIRHECHVSLPNMDISIPVDIQELFTEVRYAHKSLYAIFYYMERK